MKDNITNNVKTLPKSKDKSLQFVGDYLTEWFGDQRKQRPATMRAYESLLRLYLIPAFRDIRLTDLDEDDINGAWNAMEKEGVGLRTRVNAHMLLRTALRRAIERKFVQGDPFVWVSKPVPQDPEKRALTPDECHRILEEAKGTDYYALIHTALYTGMRRNELLALTWHRINLVEGLVEVKDNMYVGKGGEIIPQPIKTKSGIRVEVLPEESVEVLRAELDRQTDWGNEALGAGKGVDPKANVFVSEKGTRLMPDAVTHAFTRIAKEKCKIKGVSFHSLRHTHLTFLKDAGVDAKTIQARAGHSDIRTTMKTYVHDNMTMQREAVKKFSLTMKE